MGSKKQFHLLEELDHDPAASESTEQTGPIPYWDVNPNICLAISQMLRVWIAMQKPKQYVIALF